MATTVTQYLVTEPAARDADGRVSDVGVVLATLDRAEADRAMVGQPDRILTTAAVTFVSDSDPALLKFMADNPNWRPEGGERPERALSSNGQAPTSQQTMRLA